MIRFQPKLIPTLFTIPAFLVLLTLGTWQVQRLLWKEQLVADITTKSAEPSEQLLSTASFDQENVKDWLYRKVEIEGTFLHDREVHLYTGAIQFKGKTGYHILTPFERTQGRGIVIVNRGWVPEAQKESSSRPDSLVQGVQKIQAIVLPDDKRKLSLLPDNDIKENVWFWQDISEMQSYTGLTLAPVILLALQDDAHIQIAPNSMAWAEPNVPKEPFPMPSNGHISVRNDHLQYAITWYSLAVILLVVYVVYHRKGKKPV
ncbi:MAG: hypothetical protein K0R63_80 [Rickettsiales bacterium]|jgi:surfeit locus 1 family protein|nr:hypothetical protein [Rickettsiales bacterium]